MSLHRFPVLTETLSSLEKRLLDAMDGAQSPQPLRVAQYFYWERVAWTLIELGNLWVLETRIGMPRKETECFELLVREGKITPELGRRLRYVSEFRLLSARDPAKIDESYLSSDLDFDRATAIEFLGLAKAALIPLST